MDETMSPGQSHLASILLIAVSALLVISSVPVAAQDQTTQTSPMEVTSDTPEYCLHLLDRVSELVRVASNPVPRLVTDLAPEGHRMCAHGQTRGGIMRLRSALMIMEKGGSNSIIDNGDSTYR
jgi:hypothetical protein